MATESRSGRGVSAFLFAAAISSYVFYVAHSFAVRRFCAELWRLSRKFELLP